MRSRASIFIQKIIKGLRFIINLFIPPLAPINLSGQALSDTQIRVTFDDINDNETSYRIERKLTSGGIYEEVRNFSGQVGANATYTDLGLTPNTAYTYRVRIFNQFGSSPYSSEVTVATNQTPTTIPLKPQNLAIETFDADSVIISWDRNGESNFEIEQKEGNGEYAVQGTLELSLTSARVSYPIDGLTPDTTYTFRIRAYNANGFSFYSDPITVTTDSVVTNSTAVTILDEGQTAPTNGYQSNHTIDLDTTGQMLVVAIGSRDIDKVVSVKVGTTDLTKNVEQIRVNVAGTQFWTLLNPPSGQNTVTISLGGDFKILEAKAFALTSQAVIKGTGAIASSEAFSTIASNAITTQYSNSVILDAIHTTNKNTLTSNATEVGSVTGDDPGHGQLSIGLRSAPTPDDYLPTWNISDGTNAVSDNWSMSALEIITETPNQTITSPTAPSNFTATASTGQVQLSWADNANNETQYAIARSKNNLTSFQNIATLPANSTSYLDTNIDSGTARYYYALSVSNSAGSSSAPVINTFATGSTGEAAYFPKTGTSITLNATRPLNYRQLKQQKDFHDKFGVGRYIDGESSIETTDANAAEWEEDYELKVKATLFTGGTVVMWGVGVNWGNYNMAPYWWQNGALVTKSAGKVLEKFLDVWADQIGFSAAGLEFGAELPNNQAFYDAMYAKGYRGLVRIPFRMNRIFTSLADMGVNFNATSWQNLKNEVTWARNAGFTEIALDCHDYGSYPHSSGKANRYGGPNVPQSKLEDAWSKIMSDPMFKNQSDIIVEVMNEPADQKREPELANDYQLTEVMMLGVRDRLRADGVNNEIMTGTWNFSGIQDALRHDANWTTETLTCHDYIEDRNDGTGSSIPGQSYNEQNTKAGNDGNPSTGSFTFQKGWT